MRLTRAEIDLKCLRDNFDGVRRQVGPDVRVMGVVKANGYGHGMVEVAQALTDFGTDYLGVGFLEEGIELRRNGITTPTLVLGGVLGNQVHQFIQHDLEITVSSLELARHIASQCKSAGKRAKVHLKIDTGMERIGVRSEHAPRFVEDVARLPELEVAGIYSHLATSGDRDKSFAMVQLDRFEGVLRAIGERGIQIPLRHIANSGAIIDLPQSYYDLVRPGIMLYGMYPTQETTRSIPLAPVLSLKSTIVFLKDVPPNTSISYGRTYFTSSATRIATVPLGYGDGYSRRLSNQAEVLIRGRRYPVVGIVCMDQLMVDVGAGSDAHVGDEVVLLGREGGEEITAWDLAEKVGTIPYEVFTGITARVPRSYVH
jgi:alanine racemase